MHTAMCGHLPLQVVAAVEGRLVSIYDGVTQYNLGQTLHAKRGGAAWAPVDACYFAYPTMQQVHQDVEHCTAHNAGRTLCNAGSTVLLLPRQATYLHDSMARISSHR